MAEDLLPADVEQYTKGRLQATDPETQRALDEALARIRRFCGWHVSPVREETLVVDRPNSHLLFLPTLKIVSLTSVEVDGEPVDVNDIRFSHNGPGTLAFKDNRNWSSTYDNGFGQVEVTLRHGFSAAEAADFRGEVLRLIDSATISIGTGGQGPLMEKTVDDVTYRWSGMVDRSWGIAKNPLNESVLYQYRILPFA